MNPVLITSAIPAAISSGPTVRRLSRSAITAAGSWNAPDEVLARPGVDAGLAADRGVDHREQGGRHVHHPDTAHPAGGDEAREVGRRSPADGRPRRRSGSARRCPRTSQQKPAVARFLPSSEPGSSTRCTTTPGGLQSGGDVERDRLHGRLVQHGDPGGARESAPVAHGLRDRAGHAARRSPRRRAARSHTHVSTVGSARCVSATAYRPPSSAARRTASATASGARASVASSWTATDR